MKLVFLGPPGAGKGTSAALLAKESGIPHISTGDLFRSHIKNMTDLGKRVKAILDKGNLVPDEITTEIVRERLDRGDTGKGFILDGYPRTIPQAEALASMRSISAVLLFNLSEEEIIKRLSGRRVAPSSGRIYHIIFNPPKQEGKCDESGEDLIIRPDDRIDAIKNRLEVYIRQTEPLIAYYREKGLLKDVDAFPPREEVYAAVRKIIGIV
ncbi:MAG: adenylate kinase [Spirochaetales bacterium]|nr:MAG: adenylate kinase [Spirochaetales bacterium]